MRRIPLAWWIRKGFHLLLAGIVSGLFYAAGVTNSIQPLVALGGLAVILLAVDLTRPWVAAGLWRDMFAREERLRFGCLTYGVAGGVASWLIGGSMVAAQAMLLLAVVDLGAAIGGTMYGVNPLPLGGQKTWEGSISGFLLGLLVLWVWPGVHPTSVFVLLSVSLAEGLSSGTVDNLISPVVAAVVASILR